MRTIANRGGSRAPSSAAHATSLSSSGDPHGGGPLTRLSESACLAVLAVVTAAVFAFLVATRGDGSAAPAYYLVREILAGGLAAASGEIALYPIEVFKVQTQTGGKRTPMRPWARRPGVVAGAMRAMIYHGLRLGLFPAVKRRLPGGNGGSLLARIWVGAACGAVGSALCNPLDLVKTRLQRDADRYANSLHALVEIPRAAGFGALWLGAPATVLRATAGSAAQLVTYDSVKKAALARSLSSFWAVVLATLCSTVAYCSAAAPADVVKSKLMVSRDTADGKRGGSQLARIADCVGAIWREDGASGFLRGWVPSILRLLPITLVVFPLLEKIRSILGIGGF